MKRLSLFLLISLLAAANLTASFAQAPLTITATVLEVDSGDYPQVHAYLRVIDGDRLLPLPNLTAANFTAETSTGTPLTITDLQPSPRPLSVVVLMDITGSVSEVELANQQTAIRNLTSQLRPSDQLGVVVMDHEQVDILRPLSSNLNDVLAALETITPRQDVTGNVYWDGVYEAVALLEGAGAGVQKVVILMTDVNPQGGLGTQTQAAVTDLAVKNYVQIYGLYFEHEEDGIPPNAPQLPPEITALAEATGGVAWGVAGQARNPITYTDDEALPNLIQVFGDLLLGEYQLTLTSALPPDGKTQPFSINLTYQNATLPPLQTSFTAGQSAIKLSFPNLTAEQTINLPFSFTVEAQAESGGFESLTAFAINETGQETRLGEIDPTTASLTIEAGRLPAGLFRLVVKAVGIDGKTAQEGIMLRVGDSLSVTLAELPAEIQVGETVTITAIIGLPATVQSVRLLVNGAETAIQDLGPFDTVTFTWQAETSGDYTLQVRVDDILGNSANQTATIKVVGGSAANEDSQAIVLLAVIAILGGLTVTGITLIFMRRRLKRSITQLPLPRPMTPPADLEKRIMPPVNYETEDSLPAALPDEPPPPIPASPIVSPEAPSTAPNSKAIAELQGANGERWLLNEGTNSIGRHSSNTIQIRDEAISRHHAVIEVKGKRLYLKDTEASHSSEVNGQLLAIGERQELHNGDQIRMGSTVMKLVKLR